MDYFVKEVEEKLKVYQATEMEPKKLSFLRTELCIKIIGELAKRPACAMDIARSLKEHEQKIYYHLRNLEKAGIIEVVKQENRVGAIAKIYKLKSPYLAIKLVDSNPVEYFKPKPSELEFLHPFVSKGKMNSIIVVGSPDPHGRFGYQASDGYAAIDLALYLGSFLNKPTMNYKLDTQIREADLKKNLILIGGPKSNILVDKINKKLPVYFDEKNEWTIVSKISGNIYTEDEIGVVLKIPSFFAKGKFILLASGRRFKGTRAAIVAIVKHASKLKEINVVKGIDRDSDGLIDDVEFLE